MDGGDLAGEPSELPDPLPSLLITTADGSSRTAADSEFLHRKLEFGDSSDSESSEDEIFSAVRGRASPVFDDITFDGSSPAGKEVNVDSLRAQLGASQVASACGSALFVPRDALYSITNKSNVLALLRDVYPHATLTQLTEDAHRICGQGSRTHPGCRKIFAVLLLINKVHCISDVVAAGLTDVDLPLRVVWRQGLRRYEAYRKGDVAMERSLAYFNSWRIEELEAFVHNQYGVTAPLFRMRRGKNYFYKLDDDDVLPFIEYGRMTAGGYGTVWKTRIHRAHHNFQPSEDSPEDNPYFAIKELQFNNYVDFRNAVETLMRFGLGERPHPHLSCLLATYQYRGLYYLVSKWADDNLRGFWRRHPNSPMNGTNGPWLVRQCFGIAQGLRKIHEMPTWPPGYGTHGNITPQNMFLGYAAFNITPENILWFRSPNRLVISDFGLTTRLRPSVLSAHTKEEIDHPISPFSRTYRAPEYDLRQPISRRCDVWALGCLYLELISWYVLGYEAVDDFALARLEDDKPSLLFQEDKFFNLVSPETENQHLAEVKGSVKKWILRIRADCPAFIHDFLDLLEGFLLVPEPRDRYAADAVCAELMRICERCDGDAEYCARSDRGVQGRSVVHESQANIEDDSEVESDSSQSSRDSLTEPSYAKSILSTVSAASSATSFLSWGNTQTARDEIAKFFTEDVELGSLFDAAVSDPNIGGERLERNFRRLLKQYSSELLPLAEAKVYKDAAKFVTSNAAFISAVVRQQFDASHAPTTRSLERSREDDTEAAGKLQMLNKYLEGSFSADAVGQGEVVGELWAPDDQDREEEDMDELDAGHLSFSALEQVKDFLRTGEPIENLKNALKTFVFPRVTQQEPGEARVEAAELPPLVEDAGLPQSLEVGETPQTMEHTKSLQTMEDGSQPSDSEGGLVPVIEAPEFPPSLPALVDFLFTLLPAMQMWEPPIPAGKQRVRWTCKCGQNLYDDFVELVPGSLKELETELRSANGGSGASTTTQSARNLAGNVSGLGRSLAQALRSVKLWATGRSDTLPTYNAPLELNNNPGRGEPNVLHLLYCIEDGYSGCPLHQESLLNIRTDRELIKFLRKEYYKHRKAMPWLRLRHVSRVQLGKFEVDVSSFAQVHRHEKSCAPECVCLPPRERVGPEYVCRPAPEERPKRFPVFGENYLIHYFRKPQDLSATQRTIYNQLPKRACGRLRASDDRAEEGWGVFFDEGWHWPSIYFVLVVPVVTGSLVFGAVWAVKRGSIQDAFSVAAAWLTLGSLLLGYIAVRG